jgi:hypothetical protein
MNVAPLLMTGVDQLDVYSSQVDMDMDSDVRLSA